MARRHAHKEETEVAQEKTARIKFKFDRRSDDSRSTQLARHLEREIKGGALRAGDVLPSEDGLAEQLGVGRKVVRLAYGSLADAGLLVREHPHNKRVADTRKKKKSRR
jgi:DNA-binding FadR family transcriptional regulator